MSYVLLTADRAYGPDRAERSALGLLNRWAERLDELDGEVTNPRRSDYGGRIRHVRASYPATSETMSRREAFALVARELEGAYSTCAFLAAHGQVGIALGHGYATTGDAWVDLAPGGLLRVDLSFLESLYRQTQTPPESARALRADEPLFQYIGDVLRTSRQVQRVDIYACSVGYGPEGQRLLDWLHHFWGIPVRGLRGDLEVSGNELNPSVIPSVRVLRPSGAPAHRAFGREYVDRLISTPSLWRQSLRRRPALSAPP